jgi:hypothetical protein
VDELQGGEVGPAPLYHVLTLVDELQGGEVGPVPLPEEQKLAAPIGQNLNVFMAETGVCRRDWQHMTYKHLLLHNELEGRMSH